MHLFVTRFSSSLSLAQHYITFFMMMVEYDYRGGVHIFVQWCKNKGKILKSFFFGRDRECERMFVEFYSSDLFYSYSS